METSLRFDSTEKKLGVFAKENFVSDDNVVLTISGALSTNDGRVVGRAALRKKFFPEVLTRVDVGAKYDTENEEVVYAVAAKKSFELSEDGLLSLDLKAGYDFHAGQKKGALKGFVEISQKIFNFTEDQDLKLKLSYDVFGRNLYAQIRENNWTLNTDLKNKKWSIAYDL
eukprot:jgi/Mesvir1/24333/Mv11014-RA.1